MDPTDYQKDDLRCNQDSNFDYNCSVSNAGYFELCLVMSCLSRSKHLYCYSKICSLQLLQYLMIYFVVLRYFSLNDYLFLKANYFFVTGLEWVSLYAFYSFHPDLRWMLQKFGFSIYSLWLDRFVYPSFFRYKLSIVLFWG